MCLAQSSGLPATQPTQLPATAPVSPPAPGASANSARPARVTYAEGRLTVTADNSSLNQVLREISRKTGMKITGGVGDERVFGTYGPGPPADILARLLDGTGSNILLRESSTDAPAELILTPREGGPTPPNPNAPGMGDDEPAQAVSPSRGGTPVSMPPETSPVSGSATGAASNPAAASPVQLPLAFGVDSTNSTITATPTATPTTTDTSPQSTGDTVPQSPNGVKTPKQVYQQLQQLQQQQPANPQ